MAAGEMATISFGLVSIPTRMHNTVSTSEKVGFNMMCNEHKTRLKQQLVCSKDSKVIDRANVMKGYEYDDGKWVVFSQEEIKTLDEESSKTLQVQEFVRASEVSPLLVESVHYLTPDKGAERGYSLILNAMRESGYVAIAQRSSRGRSYRVMLAPLGDNIVMSRLRFGSEVKDPPSVEKVQANHAEANLAFQIVTSMTGSFDPMKVKDTRQEAMRKIVQQKIEGQPFTAPEMPKATPTMDLMAALQASLTKKE